MIVISYIAAIAAVLIVWVCIRVFWNLKIDKTNTIYELKLLTVLASILLIMRVSYFPGPVASESIESLVINFRRLLPMDVNLIPFAGLSAGDFIGKILLFVPLGLSYKFCFNEKLDNFGKIVLWGAVLSAGIEVTQLLCYNRVTDINDLIGNVIGVMAGAGIYYLICYIIRIKKERAEKLAEELKKAEEEDNRSKYSGNNTERSEKNTKETEAEYTAIETSEIEPDPEIMQSISEKLKLMSEQKK